MVDFEVPEETRMILDGVRKFIRAEVEPSEDRLADVLDDPRKTFDESGRYVPEILDEIRRIRMASAQAGYYSLFVPAEVGGGGGDFRTYYYAWEDLYHATGAGRIFPVWTFAHWATGPSTLHRFLDGKVREQFLPPLLSGERSSCFALSEPDAGSDVRNIRTRAVRDGDQWRISGTKQWVTNSPYAEYGIVFAISDPDLAAARKGGVSAFVFETDQPGFNVDSVIRMLGSAGGDEAILSFDDVVVPDAQRLGPEHEGFAVALEGVNFGRLYNGARSVGLSRWALEQAVAYSQTRVAFGKPIAEQQAIQWHLADSAIEIYAARCMGLHCAWKVDQGESVVKELSMMKTFATETCFQIFDRTIQVFGAMGLTNEVKLFDGLHTARKIRIADGSQEILRRTIARQLLKGDLSF
ncbi:MAG: acyl-CoA dehydrogenase family protein [Dehalococcoidia bacterium]